MSEAHIHPSAWSDLHEFGNALGSSLWTLFGEMAPWLLVGFAVAGLLKAFLPQSLARKHLAEGHKGAVLKAALIGVPMPLCSCSVIPVAAHLRQSGAGAGPTGAFLASTPTTGADSILATYSLLGPVYAIVRPLYALISGLIAGYWIQSATPAQTQSSSPPDTGPALPWPQRLRLGMAYGFGDLFRDTRKWLILGLILGALIDVCLPAGALDWASQNPLLGYLAVMAIAIPAYVCSTGSLPIGVALLAKGMSPGAVFLFLALGPAVSTATLAFVFGKWGRGFGWRWLASLSITGLLTALLLDALPRAWFPMGTLDHNHGAQNLWEAVGAILFLILLVRSYLPAFTQGHTHKSGTCCTSTDTSDSCAHKAATPSVPLHVFHIPDMHCDSCSGAIGRALAFGGGELHKVDLEKRMVWIQSSSSPEQIAQLLRSAGYPPAQG